MEEVYILGPLVIRQTWLIIALGFFLGFVLLRLYPVHQQHKIVGNIIFSGLIYFILTWQLSIIFFRFDVILREPLAILFFPRSLKGFFVALGTLLVYLWWRGRRENIAFVKLLASMIVVGVPALFSYFFVYERWGLSIDAPWAAWFSISDHPLHLYQLLISGLLIVAIISCQHQKHPERFVRYSLLGWSGLQWGISWLDPAPTWFGWGISPHLYGLMFTIGLLWQLLVLIKAKRKGFQLKTTAK